MCETATVITYSILECQTKAEEVALTQVSVKDMVNDVTYPCVNEITTECEYQTYPDADAIKTESAEITSSTTITLTG